MSGKEIETRETSNVKIGELPSAKSKGKSNVATNERTIMEIVTIVTDMTNVTHERTDVLKAETIDKTRTTILTAPTTMMNGNLMDMKMDMMKLISTHFSKTSSQALV